VKILLDTHILIWAAAGTLPKEAVPYIVNPENVLCFSPASIWEIVIKKTVNVFLHIFYFFSNFLSRTRPALP
jgi:PIN domain nuclease of toxin-antitoxin system